MKFELNYKASPTLSKFHNSDAFFRGVKGPIGSGKSVGMCFELFVVMKSQAKSRDGIRRTRHIVVRNTAPELETTTLKTWLDWFPEEVFGKVNRKPPISHHIKIDDIESEVIFLALDRPEDVKKLLSLEATMIWFNEARYILKEILDAATGRVGRYPSHREKPDGFEGQWPTRFGVIADTNPPDDSSWWYDMAEIKHPDGWVFFDQPSGLSESAENVENLPPSYYNNMMAGKPQEWIDVYVHGKYGFIQEGKPVYGDNYVDATHSSADVKYDSLLPVIVGVDFGLTPSAVIAQKDPFGRWRVVDEFLTPDGETWPLQDFARNLNKYLTKEYKQANIELWGDPSGGFRDQQGVTAFDLFKKEQLFVRPAPSNKFEVRREAVLSPLLRSSNGLPGIVVSRQKAPMVRRGFNGGYHYKRLNVGGEAKYKLEPEKNRFSHPHDALQYALLGGGEHKTMLGRNEKMQKPTVLPKFKIF
jgi:hypothetical protein